MNHITFEIESQKHKGFALAAVIGQSRVYRGNGCVMTKQDAPPTARDSREIDALTDQIKRLNGHIGWQGPKRILFRSKPPNPTTPTTGDA